MERSLARILRMSPRIRHIPPPLDLEAALLMHSDASEPEESFKIYLRSLGEPKKKRASKRRAPSAPAGRTNFVSPPPPRPQIESPASTLAPSKMFLVPRFAITSVDDLRPFAQQALLREYRDHSDARYHCPSHHLDKPTVTLHTQGGWDTLVHCHQCGYWLTPTELIAKTFDPAEVPILFKHVWPNRVAAGRLDAEELVRIQASLARHEMLKLARCRFLGQRISPGSPGPFFGDWGVLLYRELLELLSRASVPPQFDMVIYRICMLRDQAGAVAAVDVYSLDYQPLFRYWFQPASADGKVFLVPFWGDLCDPANGTMHCQNALEAHDANQQVIEEPKRSRWVRSVLLASAMPRSGGVYDQRQSSDSQPQSPASPASKPGLSSVKSRHHYPLEVTL